jgi:hypothetical protein
MALSIEGRAMRNAALVVVVLHTLTALWVWRSWGEFGRGTVLVWMDFPVSFAYLHLPDPQFLAGSLLLGGIQWALVAALLTYLLGRSTRRA